jgi:hypothetical protein
MSGDDWRDARKYRQRKRNEMVECPRCAWKSLDNRQSPPLYHVGEKCSECGEEVG